MCYIEPKGFILTWNFFNLAPKNVELATKMLQLMLSLPNKGSLRRFKDQI